ncbi:hypothetical protein BV900_17125 [Agrobacterium tumefaciens]|nr:hypothetical protein BV900_17125 [Agrobacterium tumefaciens]
MAAADTEMLTLAGTRSGRVKLWVALTAGVVITGLGTGAWFWQSDDVDRAVATDVNNSDEEQVLVVEPRPVSQYLDIIGTIAAGKSVAIVAPFDGVIREKRMQLGDHVNVGDVLVVMDTSEIASRYRDAQSAYIKAAMAADALDKWDTGSDMQRARRALLAAEAQLSALDRQMTELKALLDQGIVSRNEYDGAAQQRDNQVNTVASARDELASTQTRGNDENRKLVMLELENAQSRLNDLKMQMAGASVATAVAGILTRPPENGSKEPLPSVEPGASVTRGSALFAIADTSTFTVTGKVDEIDVNRVRIGQPVTIVIDAVAGSSIAGRIVGVSAEAESVSRGGSPSFGVRASFSIEDKTLLQAVRIGMSGRMTIETYANAEALIVPPSAILNEGSEPQIKVRRDGNVIAVPVVLGATFPSGVEITGGLKKGDSVVHPR